MWSGAFWTAVTTRFTGLSTTYRDPEGCCGPNAGVQDVGNLDKKLASELIQYARSDNTVEASIGVAAINSLIEVDEERCTELNAFDILAEKGKGRNIAVVGHFPFVPKLRKKAKNLWVIEKRLRPGDLPENEAARILPQCDVVCLSGTTLINHTLDDLLSLCRDAYVVLTGASSPLTPVLFDHGVDAICGTQVVDGPEVIKCVCHAATFRQIKGHGIRLLTLSKY